MYFNSISDEQNQYELLKKFGEIGMKVATMKVMNMIKLCPLLLIYLI